MREVGARDDDRGGVVRRRRGTFARGGGPARASRGRRGRWWTRRRLARASPWWFGRNRRAMVRRFGVARRGTPTRRRDVRARHASCCGGNESTPRSMDVGASLSSDEDEFVSQAGMLATAAARVKGRQSSARWTPCSRRRACVRWRISCMGTPWWRCWRWCCSPSVGSRTWGRTAEAQGWCRRRWRPRFQGVRGARVLLGGDARICELGVRSRRGAREHTRVDDFSRVGNYLARMRHGRGIVIGVVRGAHFVENRLTLHARGDLKALWGTVPTTAEMVTMNADGNPDLGSLRRFRRRM